MPPILISVLALAKCTSIDVVDVLEGTSSEPVAADNSVSENELLPMNARTLCTRWWSDRDWIEHGKSADLSSGIWEVDSLVWYSQPGSFLRCSKIARWMWNRLPASSAIAGLEAMITAAGRPTDLTSLSLLNRHTMKGDVEAALRATGMSGLSGAAIFAASNVIGVISVASTIAQVAAAILLVVEEAAKDITNAKEVLDTVQFISSKRYGFEVLECDISPFDASRSAAARINLKLPGHFRARLDDIYETALCKQLAFPETEDGPTTKMSWWGDTLLDALSGWMNDPVRPTSSRTYSFTSKIGATRIHVANDPAPPFWAQRSGPIYGSLSKLSSRAEIRDASEQASDQLEDCGADVISRKKAFDVFMGSASTGGASNKTASLSLVGPRQEMDRRAEHLFRALRARDAADQAQTRRAQDERISSETAGEKCQVEKFEDEDIDLPERLLSPERALEVFMGTVNTRNKVSSTASVGLAGAERVPD